jgi:asparagine synthase (glutamine-hydrolysing)
MCGIVGYFQFRGQVGAELHRSMGRARDLLGHRGPDGSGMYGSPNGSCVLGHVRLSILDLSDQGLQPMSNEDGSLWIVFNGEIYNYLELRSSLTRKGHKFRSLSDTEVVIHLYEEEGEASVHSLDGEFAFVIYDAKKDRIFGARDRFGVKPLYYSLSTMRFAFASEPKALLVLPDVSREPRLSELPNYLSFNCLPGPSTLYKDVEKLEPGTVFKTTREGVFRKDRFWLPGKQDPEDRNENLDLKRALEERLRNAVRKRMISDVPFGAMLSGGIDSSLVVALMSEENPLPVETFTVGYPGDETIGDGDVAHARLVAKTFRTHHHELILTEDDVASALEELPRMADDPIGAPSVTANALLARFARQNGIKVIQVGEGADEVFCGYSVTHRLWRLHDRLMVLDGILRKPLAGLLAEALGPLLNRFGNPSLIGSMNDTIVEHLKRYSRGEHLYWGFGSLFTETERAKLFRASRHGVDPYDSLRLRQDEVPGFHQRSYLDQLSLIDQMLGLPERLLMRVDKATMMYGVEARVPFLDPEVVELAFRVPPAIRAPVPKGILRDFARLKLPIQVVERRKIGFPTSSKVFLGTGMLARIRDSILESRFLEVTGLDRHRVEWLLQGKGGSRSGNFYYTWSLYILSLWFHHWVEGDH